jgi:hypothetical protein
MLRCAPTSGAGRQAGPPAMGQLVSWFGVMSVSLCAVRWRDSGASAAVVGEVGSGSCTGGGECARMRSRARQVKRRANLTSALSRTMHVRMGGSGPRGGGATHVDKGALAHLGNLAYASLRAAEDAALVRLILSGARSCCGGDGAQPSPWVR